MNDLFKKESGVIFLAGALCGAVGLEFAKTEKARKLLVKVIAKGMIAKDCITENVANIREEAEDVCNEARNIAKQNCDETND